MPLLTADQLKRIREIIDRFHTGFAIAVFGKEVDPALEESLKRAGLIPADAPRLIDDAYVYAQLLARAGDLALMHATPETIVNRIAVNPAPPYTDVERATIQTARTHAGEYCRGLASRVATAVAGKLTGHEASLTPDEIRDIIKDKTAENRERREMASDLKSDLGHDVGNWTRDWLRIATSESNDAIQEGIAATYERDYGGEDGSGDPDVSKLVRPDCCKDCRRLYVGADGEPIVFKMSTLRANGSNVGRPRKAWKAVVGNTHPWCGCTLVLVAAGMAWSGGVLLPKDKIQKSHKLHDRYSFQGMPISIETMEGTPRHWGDPNSGDHGTTWNTADYGYIKETEGADGEHIDCYVGDDETATHVYVVHQRKKRGPDRFEGHDEDKVMLGYPTADAAKVAYTGHYTDPRFFGSMTAIPVERFKKILAHNKGKQLRKIQDHPKLDLEPLGKANAWSNMDGLVDMAMKPPLTRAVPINVVQGADNVPVRERSPGKAQIVDEMGLSAKGRKKRRKQLKAAQQARTESRKRHDPGWTGQPLGLLPKDKAGAYERAEDFKPPMVDQLREEAVRTSLAHGAHKREVAEDILRHRLANNRVSDITVELARLRKSGPKLVLDRRPRVNVFARALAKSQGPFIGPKGGKWANVEHTIPWKADQLPADYEPKEGDEHEIHARGLHPFTAHIASVDGDTVRVAQQKGGAYGATMPKASVRHFINDLRAVVDGPESKDPRVNALIQGKAEFLGKGDDGIAFKVGDHVVKASTTVPYQPFNQGHLTPEAAAGRMEAQVKTSNAMADDGVPGIMRSEIVHNGDKAFQIKPYVEIPEKLSRAQLDSVAESVLAAHKHGWVFNDEIQVGVHDGKLVHFDTGKAARSQPNSDSRPAHFGTDKDDDIRRLKELYAKHGEKYLTDAEKEDPHEKWEQLAWDTDPKGMSDDEKKAHRGKLLRHSSVMHTFLKNHPEHPSFFRGDEMKAETKRAMDRFK